MSCCFFSCQGVNGQKVPEHDFTISMIGTPRRARTCVVTGRQCERQELGRVLLRVAWFIRMFCLYAFELLSQPAKCKFHFTSCCVLMFTGSSMIATEIHSKKVKHFSFSATTPPKRCGRNDFLKTATYLNAMISSNNFSLFRTDSVRRSNSFFSLASFLSWQKKIPAFCFLENAISNNFSPFFVQHQQQIKNVLRRISQKLLLRENNSLNI